MNMGSNATLIAVASIPPRIWEQDKSLWKAWIVSIDTTYDTKQTYKQIITRFYSTLELPIQQVTEQHINDYQEYLQDDGKSERTVRSYMSIVRKYWRFAQTQEAMAQPN